MPGIIGGPDPDNVSPVKISSGVPAILLLLLTGCRAEPAANPGVLRVALRVAVSVGPQAELVRRIGGDRVAVTTMLLPGASDEDVSLSPRQVFALENVQLYVAVGHPAFPMEARYIRPFLARHPEVRVVDMSGNSHEGDPHVWVSPETMTVAARNVAAALEGMDPTHGAGYRKNLARFLEDAGRLDREVRARLSAPGASRVFLVYHPSWGYFARRYGLEQIAIEAEGKEPGAAQLIQLIDRARREHATVVLVPEGFPRNSARVIADAIGGRVVSADPLAPDWEATLLRVAEVLSHA
jgi:zinc transport system substrate-binding protein